MTHQWDDKKSKFSAKCMICGLHRFAEKYNGRTCWVYYKNSELGIFKCPPCKNETYGGNK